MTFQFVRYSVRGAAAAAAGGSVDPDGRRSFRETVQVVTTIDGQPLPNPPAFQTPELRLYGPGDVVGIDPSQIVRRAPRPLDQQMEPNYLASIEFADPALPWLFGAASVDGDPDHPMPWIMLVVVEDPDGRAVHTRAGAACPVVTVHASDALPKPEEAWAWAHTQAHVGAAQVDQVLSSARPEWSSVRSRLLCPTQLKPLTPYAACVVPVYEAGRLAGLGEPSAGHGTTFWTAGAETVLPVYDQWSFRTGPVGDFESLARLLRPVTDYEGVGDRHVAVDAIAARLQPHGATPDFSAAVRAVPTAIAKTDGPGSLAPERSDDPQAAPLRALLKPLLDLTAAAPDEDPIVGPPLYGQWPAAVTSLDGAPGEPFRVPGDPAQRWVTEVNADPDLRVAAGAATRVVQRDQESLMQDAWQQLEGVLAANRRIRWSQLSASISAPLYQRVDSLQDEQALRIAAPAISRIRDAGDGDGDRTLAAAVDTSNVPAEVIGAAFTRFTRYAAAAVSPAAAPAEHEGSSPVTALVVDGLRRGDPAFLPTWLPGSPPVQIAGPKDLLAKLTPETGTAGIDVAALQARTQALLSVTAIVDDIRVNPLSDPRIAQPGVDITTLAVGDDVGVLLERPGGVVATVALAQQIQEQARAAAEQAKAAQLAATAEHEKAIQAQKIAEAAQADQLAREQLAAAKERLAAAARAEEAAKAETIAKEAKAKQIEGIFKDLAAEADAAKGVKIVTAHGIHTLHDFVDAATAGAEVHTLGAGALVRPTSLAHARSVATFAHGLIQRDQLSVPLGVADELQTFAASGRDTLSLPAAVVVNQAGLARDAGRGIAALSLAEADAFAFPTAEVESSVGVFASAGLSAEDAISVSAVNTIRATALAAIGVHRPLVPEELVRLGSEDRVKLAKDAATARAKLAIALADEGDEQARRIDLVKLEPEIRDQAVSALKPEPNFRRMLDASHQLGSEGLPGRPRQRSPLHPIMASPVFTSAAVDRLQALDPEWVLGGAAKLPANSIAILSANRRFVEAFLAAANHEMARELRWRGYPTDMKGTCFAHFWPTPAALAGAPNVVPQPDITPLHTWSHPLGHNGPGGDRPLTVVVIKGDLLRRYPNTIVTAERGPVPTAGGTFTAAKTAPEVFRGSLHPDLSYVALDVGSAVLREEEQAVAGEHWYISLKQPIDEPRFGLDAADSAVAPATPTGDPQSWSWATFGSPDKLAAAAVDAGAGAGAHRSESVARNLYQHPFRLLLRATTYLPKDAP